MDKLQYYSATIRMAFGAKSRIDFLIKVRDNIDALIEYHKEGDSEVEFVPPHPYEGGAELYVTDYAS